MLVSNFTVVNGKSTIVDFKLDVTLLRYVANSVTEMPRVPGKKIRRNFKFEPELYMNAVVMPWYRGSENPFYSITEVLF